MKIAALLLLAVYLVLDIGGHVDARHPRPEPIGPIGPGPIGPGPIGPGPIGPGPIGPGPIGPGPIGPGPIGTSPMWPQRCPIPCPIGSYPDRYCRCQSRRWNPCWRTRCRPGMYCIPRGRRGVCVYGQQWNICRQPMRQGQCQSYTRRYFYNSFTGRCQRFTYGGCGGNQNNFYTWRQCNRRCGRQRRWGQSNMWPQMFNVDPSSDS